MTDLIAEKKRIEAKHKALKAILGWLADLPAEDAVQVLQHVGIDFGVAVSVLASPTPAVAGKVG